MPKHFQLLLFFFFLECLPLPPQLDSVLIKQISHVGNVVLFLSLYQPLHFTLSYMLLSENEMRGAQTKTHKELTDEYKTQHKHKMEVRLLPPTPTATTALTSHLRVPSILTPLGLKLLMNLRGSLPMPPCLLPSHLPPHTKMASVPRSKTRIKPNLQIPNLLRQTRHQVWS